MYIIDGKIISAALFDTFFVCNLEACKGACCWEGDFGAPVMVEEIQQMNRFYKLVKPLLDKNAQDIVDRKGVSVYDLLYDGRVTPLREDGSCVYLLKDRDGIAQCAWELLYEQGVSTFVKPVSCHLYPVRMSKNEKTRWEALNYDTWDICAAACTLGETLQMPVFRFVKKAIVRAYGEDFYDQMEGIYEEFFDKNR